MPKSRGDKGDEWDTPDLFGAQVTAIRVSGMDAQPLQTVMFPETRTMVVPPLPNYAGNETIERRIAGTLFDCAIISGRTYRTVPVDLDPQLSLEFLFWEVQKEMDLQLQEIQKACFHLGTHNVFFVALGPMRH